MLLSPRTADTDDVSTVRKLLLAVLLVSLAGSAFGAGTFASFSASTTNAGSVFSTGTLILSNTKTGGSGACFSSATGAAGVDAANDNTGCDAFFTTTVSKPSDTASADITLKNEGTINATTLAAVATCNTVDGSTPNTNDFHGTADLCTTSGSNNVQIQIQEYTSNTFATPVAKCIYPANTGAVCSTNYSFVGATAAIGTAVGTAANWNGGTLAINAGASRFIKVNVILPTAADNTVQGRAVTFGLTWTINQ
jgi:hypothetical protein